MVDTDQEYEVDTETSEYIKMTQVNDLDFDDPMYLYASDINSDSILSFKPKGT